MAKGRQRARESRYLVGAKEQRKRAAQKSGAKELQKRSKNKRKRAAKKNCKWDKVGSLGNSFCVAERAIDMLIMRPFSFLCLFVCLSELSAVERCQKGRQKSNKEHTLATLWPKCANNFELITWPNRPSYKPIAAGAQSALSLGVLTGRARVAELELLAECKVEPDR